MRSRSGRLETTEASPRANGTVAKFVVRVEGCPATPQEKSCVLGSLLIGAGPDCDIVIAHRTVSRRHLRLTLAEEGLVLADLDSRNGTFIQGQRVTVSTLTGSAVIRLGAVTVRLELTEKNHCPEAKDLVAFGRYSGRSAAIKEVIEILDRASQSDMPLLIEGESGTGKDLVATEVHARSARRHGALVAANCGAMDRHLARSELFGHAKGAFTGASEARSGLLERADGGTLFLDEVGELPLDVQPVLLRALETETVTRLGETRQRKAALRVVAATNRNLRNEVRAGRFREDLYFRLAVVRVQLPPLRERREDIEPLVELFMQELGVLELPPYLLETLKSYSWPGNVRELRNALRGYSIVRTLNLDSSEAERSTVTAGSEVDLSVPYQLLKKRNNDKFIRSYLELLLTHTGGNQSEAARVSGLDRSHLNRLVAQFARAAR